MSTAKLSSVERILRKYTSAENVTTSIGIMRKLGKVGGSVTHRQAAQLAYLACSNESHQRTRNALAMERDNTLQAAVVNSLKRQIQSGHSSPSGTVPADLVKELAGAFSTRNNTPGYVDGKRIEVRGGAHRDWSLYPSNYVVDNDTP